MARPIKNNADYFPHDSNMRNDPKLKAVRKKFNHIGYSVYNMCIELLTDCDGFRFELTELNYELLSGDFDIEVKELKEIITYFIKLDLFQFDKKTKILTNKTLEKGLSPLLSKRKRDRKPVIDSENPQSKVKYSKEKKSIELKTKYADKVFMHDQEHRTLVEKFGEQNTKRCIDKLNNYKKSKGVEYDSDYHAIHSWVIERLGIEPEKSGRFVC